MTFGSDSVSGLLISKSERSKLGAPKHADGFVYGFLFRLLIAVLAVIVPVPIFFVAALFVGKSHPSSFELVLFGGFIALTIFIGEHLRSLIYERSIVRRQKNILYVRRGGRSLDELKSDLGTAGHQWTSPAIKRAFDVVAATVALVALAPVLIAAMLAVALDSRGPILDRERRLGINGRPVQFFRFRTTRADGTITAAGHVLRRTSIRELPQLFNVIRGEMSIVGRSLYQFDGFDSGEVTREASMRGVKPGLISLPWLVEYPLSNTNRIAADMYYVDHWSLWMDLKMIVVAIPKFLSDNKNY